MRKKLLSVFLTLAIVLSLAPAVVWADGEGDETAGDTADEGVEITFGQLEKLPSIVDDETVTLESLGKFEIPTKADSDKTLTVTGTAEYISGWVKFNDKVEKEQSGHYLPIQIILPDDLGTYEKITITGAGDENPKEVDGFTSDDHSVELVIRLDDLTDKRFTVQYGDDPVYTIDCSEVTLNSETDETEEYTVTFIIDGKDTGNPQKVGQDGKVTEPNVSPREGYTLDGWYKEAAYTTKWNFDSDTVTANITLYAKWTEVEKPADPTPPNPVSRYEVIVNSSIRHGSVSVSDVYAEPGTRVTITVTPELDYQVSWVEAVRSSGRSLYLTQNGRRYTFTMPAGDVYVDAGFSLRTVYSYAYIQPIEPVKPVEVKPTFVSLTWRPAVEVRDASVVGWNYQAVQWAYQNGYLDLASNGSFQVNDPVSHIQMWRIMAQWMNAPASDNRTLTNWAMQNGAAKGSPADSPMTRQDVVTYLYQCCFLMGGDVSSTGNLSEYQDNRQITAVSARNAWSWAVSSGIISGTTDGYLNPSGLITRGEFASILMRLCQ